MLCANGCCRGQAGRADELLICIAGSGVRANSQQFLVARGSKAPSRKLKLTTILHVRPLWKQGSVLTTMFLKPGQDTEGFSFFMLLNIPTLI